MWAMIEKFRICLSLSDAASWPIRWSLPEESSGRAGGTAAAGRRPGLRRIVPACAGQIQRTRRPRPPGSLVTGWRLLRAQPQGDEQRATVAAEAHRHGAVGGPLADPLHQLAGTGYAPVVEADQDVAGADTGRGGGAVGIELTHPHAAL